MNIVNRLKLFFTGILVLCSLSLNAFAASSNSDANKAAFFAMIERNSATSMAQLPISLKVEYLSATLLTAPYVDGSLGEGEQGKYDQDPLVRFDVFDCTTYVETVLAGAMSTSVNDFMPNLMGLRYKSGIASFITRNHFPSTDWIANNQNKLIDITEQIVGDGLSIAKTVIDKPAWYKKMGKDRLTCVDESSEDCDILLTQLQNEGHEFIAETVQTPYVPLTALYFEKTSKVNQELLDRIPSGSIINMVRPNWNIKQWIGTNMNVSHQGIAIRKGKQLFLRHASKAHRNVMDVDFLEYFSHYSEASSLKGFNVQKLR